MQKAILSEQKRLCDQFKMEFSPVEEEQMVGVSKSFLERNLFPINGLRHSPEGIGSGWFFWAGGDEIPPDPKFFEPVHVKHLLEEFPEIVKYLALPPGARIQIDLVGYEDVWFDETLLK